MHSDSKKLSSFLALLFAAGDLRRWAATDENGNKLLKNSICDY